MSRKTVDAWRLSPARMAAHLSRGRFVIPRHVALLDQIIVRAASVPDGRFILELPVRHGKSELLSRWTPVWYLSTFADRSMAIASYGHELAAGFGRFARERVREHSHVLGVDVDPASSAADRWEIVQRRGGSVSRPGGKLYCVGVGGPLTGRGVDLLVVDDAHKDAESALSQVSRDSVWAWYESVASTRLEPGASVIVCASRWHSDDLSGRLLKRAKEEGGEHWEEIRLPALAEEHDPLGRQPGEALWPERFDRERLEKIRAAKSPWVWASLYSQRPIDEVEGTGLTEQDIRRWKTLPVSYEVVITADLSFADPTSPAKGKRSKTAIQAWAVTDANAYLLDRDTRHMDFAQQEEAVMTMYRRYKDKVRRVLVERAANGFALISRLSTQIPYIEPVDPKGSKYLRFSAVVPFFRNGAALIPPDGYAPWVREYVQTLTTFPACPHDDDCDATSQLLSRIYLPQSEKDLGEKTQEQIDQEWIALGEALRGDGDDDDLRRMVWAAHGAPGFFH